MFPLKCLIIHFSDFRQRKSCQSNVKKRFFRHSSVNSSFPILGKIARERKKTKTVSAFSTLEWRTHTTNEFQSLCVFLGWCNRTGCLGLIVDGWLYRVTIFNWFVCNQGYRGRSCFLTHNCGGRRDKFISFPNVTKSALRFLVPSHNKLYSHAYDQRRNNQKLFS